MSSTLVADRALGGQNCTIVLLAKENEEIDVAEVMHRIPRE
jgi:hypothetical protein